MAPATCAVVIAALKFFYQHTIQREWSLFDLLRPRREKKLPVVLSQEEVQRILDCVYRQRQRVCLVTIYSCGLRIHEATRLQVHQIDSEYMRLHIYQGKGNKERHYHHPFDHFLHNFSNPMNSERPHRFFNRRSRHGWFKDSAFYAAEPDSISLNRFWIKSSSA
mgnify:CR=1 FL=1